MNFTSLRLVAAGLLAAACAPMAAFAVEQDLDSALASLRANANGQLSYRHDAADAYTLLRAEAGSPLLVDDASASPHSRALNFLNRYGAVVGLRDAAQELSLLRVSRDPAGNQHVHLAQRHAGLPVFGARLVVHLNEQGVYGLNGMFVRDLASLPRQAALPAAQLNAAALRALAKDHPAAELTVESAQLMFYRSGVLEDFAGRSYLAQEVLIRSQAGDVRERVIMDALGGGVINRIDQIHTQLNREIYTPNENVPPVITEGGATAPADVPLTGDQPSDPATRIPRAPTDNLYIFAGGTYELYANMFDHFGYDHGATPPEEQVQKSVYLVNEACPNAYWNGHSTNYCPGFDADDVVSHEWTHGYTEYTHGLIYQYQSGALNESYSDIFGEVYDLVNGLEGPLGVTLTEGEYFETGGSRWVVGEDLSEPAAALLLRDMWDPDNFAARVPLLGIDVLNTGSPGSVISSPNYYCGSGDGGGVHTNSAVPNHAFAMLVDGKAFNGVEIPAIGMTRAAHIYFHAMSNYQTPTTNFIQHADALEQSCADLIGAPLKDVQGNPSPDVIGPQTCAAVAAAMLSVEMRQSPHEKCGYQPLLQPETTTPALCADGQAELVDYSEDWESGAFPQGWVVSENISGDTSEDVSWVITDELPQPHGGYGAFMPNTFGGSCAPGGDISASFRLDSPAIELLDDSSNFEFTHLMQSEFAYDGGNLKVSINDGGFALVPSSAFRYNRYNDDLELGGPAGNTNPIAGEPAWTGSDEGESFSTWGTSQVDLSKLGAKAGDKVRFRFEFGQDGCNGNLGWYVDELRVSHCAVARAAPVSAPATAPEVAARATGVRGGALGLGSLILAGLLLARRRG